MRTIHLKLFEVLMIFFFLLPISLPLIAIMYCCLYYYLLIYYYYYILFYILLYSLFNFQIMEGQTGHFRWSLLV